MEATEPGLPGDDRYLDARERLCREADRVTDRLRSMSLVRLGAELGDGRTRAQAALDCAQVLADACAELARTARRMIPELPAHAVGDVIAVMTNDLLAELDRRGWDEHARQYAVAASAVLRGLRQVL